MDPATGRFVSEDPAKDGVNWYVYCSNNPLTRTDPTGLWDKVMKFEVRMPTASGATNNSPTTTGPSGGGFCGVGLYDRSGMTSTFNANLFPSQRQENQMAQALPGVMAVNAATNGGENNGTTDSNSANNNSNEDQRQQIKDAGKAASPVENAQTGGNGDGNKQPPNNTTGGDNNSPDPTPSPTPKKQYSGDLTKMNKPDSDADALAEKLKGQSRVSFANDPNKREFDVVSDEYIAQTKVIKTLGSDFRAQAKATFEAAKQTGRKVYYELSPNTSPEIINKINEYSSRYGVQVRIEFKTN